MPWKVVWRGPELLQIDFACCWSIISTEYFKSKLLLKAQERCYEEPKFGWEKLKFFPVVIKLYSLAIQVKKKSNNRCWDLSAMFLANLRLWKSVHMPISE